MVSIAGAMVAGATAAASAVLGLALYDRREGRATCAEAVASPALSQECAVCLSELAGEAELSDDPESSAVRTLAECGHGFHEVCIGRWLPLRPECPLCRRPVLPEVTADGQPDTMAVVPAPQAEVAPAWSRPARMACGFGDGRVVWTRSPSVQR